MEPTSEAVFGPVETWAQIIYEPPACSDQYHLACKRSGFSLLARVSIPNLPGEVPSLFEIWRFGFQPYKVCIRCKRQRALDGSLDRAIDNEITCVGRSRRRTSTPPV